MMDNHLRTRKKSGSKMSSTKEVSSRTPNVKAISDYLFGRPEPPIGSEHLINMYCDSYIRKGSRKWTSLENATWSLIAGTCKILVECENHAGLRYSYLESIDALFKSLHILIDEGESIA